MFSNPILSPIYLLLGSLALYFSNHLFSRSNQEQWLIHLGANVLAIFGTALLLAWIVHVWFALRGNRPSSNLPTGDVICDPKVSLSPAKRTIVSDREISHRVGNTVYLLDYPDKRAAFRTIQPVLKWDDQATPHPYSKVQGIWVDDHNGSLALYGGHIVRVYAHSESSFRITYLNMAHPDSFPTLELAKQFAPSFAIAVLVKTLRSVGVPEQDAGDPLFQHL